MRPSLLRLRSPGPRWSDRATSPRPPSSIAWWATATTAPAAARHSGCSGTGSTLASSTTAARVMKKFQCTPYSLKCSWYSTDLTAAMRAAPMRNSGPAVSRALRHVCRCRRPEELSPCCGRCEAEPRTRPWANTKLPVPTSIRPLPYTSAFANRRGKTWKSTAKMAKLVITSRPARYQVRNRIRDSMAAEAHAADQLPACCNPRQHTPAKAANPTREAAAPAGSSSVNTAREGRASSANSCRKRLAETA
mmetsp:Transcript_26556/g.74605  ORF Transcript_26556/g.74605 Transcript_26556/m.74605 type:complete len:249 (-) Transcript_26556:38-784(-)